MEVTISPLGLEFSRCYGNGHEFHDSPDDVKNGGKNHADKQENEWIVQNTLHDGDASVALRSCCFLIHSVRLIVAVIAGDKSRHFNANKERSNSN